MSVNQVIQDSDSGVTQPSGSAHLKQSRFHVFSCVLTYSCVGQIHGYEFYFFYDAQCRDEMNLSFSDIIYKDPLHVLQ